MNLVAQLADPGDGRPRRLTLTREGRRLEAELTGAQARLLGEAFDAAGPHGRAGWMHAMERLAGD